jgi:oligopeptide transport system permease protein
VSTIVRELATTPAGSPDVVSATSGRRAGFWGDAFSRLRRNRLAMCGLVGVLLLLLVATFADALAPYPYDRQHLGHVNEQPSWGFPLGTDLTGRDMLSRMIHGARVSLAVALVSQVAVLLIAVPIGSIAGLAGGWTDLIVMRVVDVLQAVPALLLAILVVGALGRELEHLFLALILTSWLTLARLTRAEMLSLREREFVVAARAIGAGPLRIVARHLLPNALGPIVVAVTFGIPQIMFAEAALSFIGIGVNPPMPSWGQMVGDHQQYLRSSWWLAAYPSAAIAFTMLSFTFLGDGLRDALDPRMSR